VERISACRQYFSRPFAAPSNWLRVCRLTCHVAIRPHQRRYSVWTSLLLALGCHESTLLLLTRLVRYFCIQSVYDLNTSADNLTVNMVLTVRKVVSLIASVVVFNNAFTVFHVVGTAMVFGGATLYSFVTTAPASNVLSPANAAVPAGKPKTS
jgi:UAA transporter family